jgi:lipoprotein-releasing system permease protein
MKHNINTEIANTYVTTNKRLTVVAVLGIVLGLGIYIFMNSMVVGFDKTSMVSVFKASPHIRVYKDDEFSEPLVKNEQKTENLIINPKVVPKNNAIIDPMSVLEIFKAQEDVVIATMQVSTNVFFNNGKSQINGNCVGVIPEEANQMFAIQATMVEGNFDDLKSNVNGIVLGVGIAQKMNVHIGDNISITSQRNVSKVMKVVGLFQTNNSLVDKTKSYVNIALAQQLMRESTTYVTDININIKNPDEAVKYAKYYSELTAYKAEDWESANETLMAATRMRRIIIGFISSTIMLIAGFGIYNILNMTISQKINDIAILKAMGFRGGDVIRIFVRQAMTIGFIGIVIGMGFASLLITVLSKVYIGGDIGYFPIDYEPKKFLQGVIFGLIITFFAGFLPARKAANIDPVSIFRK